MQRRTPSATSALLQRVNSQLKGERIKKPEDELDVSFYSILFVAIAPFNAGFGLGCICIFWVVLS